MLATTAFLVAAFSSAADAPAPLREALNAWSVCLATTPELSKYEFRNADALAAHTLEVCSYLEGRARLQWEKYASKAAVNAAIEAGRSSLRRNVVSQYYHEGN